MRTVLRKLLSTAVEWRLLSMVPPIKWLRAPAGEFDFLTFDEADRLIAGSKDEWRAMIIIALRTGLRHSELIGLRWIDVDLNAGRLVVRQAVSEGVIDTQETVGRARSRSASRRSTHSATVSKTASTSSARQTALC